MAGSGQRDIRRRLEQAIRNPECEANLISVVSGVGMAEVARQEGADPVTGQSPFAITRGLRFEKTLLDNQGERLVAALKKEGVLPRGEVLFVDCRVKRHGGTCAGQSEARDKTDRVLRRAAAPRRRLPAVIAGATVSIPGGLLLPEGILVLDVLIARLDLDQPELIAGEIKTYPDRGGYTDGVELATARAQLGTYVHGLRLRLANLGLAGRLAVSDRGFLVMTRPGSPWPSIRANEELRYQVLRAERGFAALQEVAASVASFATEDEVIAAIRAADTAYCEACLGFCEREATCQARAFDRGEAAVLGDEARRLLGSITLDRGVKLLSDAEPRNAAEAGLRRQLRQIREVWV